MVRAVTFDFWNTLMFENPLGTLRDGRMRFWRDSVDGFEEGAYGAAHDAAHNAYVSAWKSGTQYVIRDAAELMARELGSSAPSIDDLLAGFVEGGRHASIATCAGAGECLATLSDQGIGLGIVCDIGLTSSEVLLELLEREGLIGYFAAPVFSDQVGSYKPEPDMFVHCLDILGAEPADAFHVGDRLRTDIGGARDMGMGSIRYTGVFDDDAHLDEADFVVGALTAIPDLLEAQR